MLVRFHGPAALLAACFLSLTASRALSAEDKEPLQLRTYPVADLIIALPDAGDADRTARGQEPRATTEDRLVQLLLQAVAPASWQRAGGRGTIDYYPLGMALLINQTAEVHQRIATVLATLRKLQDTEIALEIRFLSVSEPLFERIGIDFNVQRNPGDTSVPQPVVTKDDILTESLGLKFLNDAQVRQLLESAQGDRGTNILQAPKITLLNGQAGTVNVTDTQYFLTGLDVVGQGQSVVLQPRNEPFQTGLRMTARPAVSADRRFVEVFLKVDLTSLESSPVPLMPVAIPVEGKEGKTVFTQFLQQPKLSRLAIEKTVAIPDGSTVLFGGLKKVSEARTDFGPPVLNRIPYLNRLFKNASHERETEQVFVMVTPRIIVNADTAAKSPPAAAIRPCSEWRQEEAQEDVQTPQGHGSSPRQTRVLGEVLRAYEEACAEGRTDEAEKLARAALAVDPTCFRKR